MAQPLVIDAEQMNQDYNDAGSAKWIYLQDDQELEMLGIEISVQGAYFYDLGNLPNLHRLFSNLKGDEQSILKFAREYGFLGSQTFLIATDSENCYWGESLDQWRYEIQTLRFLIELWDILRTDRNAGKLKSLLDFEHDLVYIKDGKIDSEYAYNSVQNSHIYHQPSKSGKPDFLSLSQLFFECQIESLVMDYCSASVKIEPYPRLSFDAETLIGTIYMHFVNEVLGKSLPLVKCQVCEQWFQSRHKGTMYCSDACKVKAYRLRKEKEKQDGKAKK